ncbi:hypothetical protein AAD018_018305 [Aestuariibius insulae]|uniref:hypothetical protein n=1 Tax=Aestuariibius insulae TaxID=2058287 RepID=UPI00398F0024
MIEQRAVLTLTFSNRNDGLSQGGVGRQPESGGFVVLCLFPMAHLHPAVASEKQSS